MAERERQASDERAGAGSPLPGSGSANTYIAALAAELVRSVAIRTTERPRYRSVHRTAEEIAERARKASMELRAAASDDAGDFAAVVALRKKRDDSALVPEIDEHVRMEALRRELDALRPATERPLRVAALSVEIADAARTLFDHGVRSARSESHSAANAALCASASSLFVATVNLRELSQKAMEITHNEDLLAWIALKMLELEQLQRKELRLRRQMIRRLSAFRKAGPRRRKPPKRVL